MVLFLVRISRRVSSKAEEVLSARPNERKGSSKAIYYEGRWGKKL